MIDPWISLIDWHLGLRPRMQARDVYKLLYQGVLGPEHLVGLAEAFEARLREELAAVEADESQPLLEAIHPDRTLARINLRPYKAGQGEVSQLALACLETAQQGWGMPDELRQAWKLYLSACQACRWPNQPASEVMDFSNWLEEHNYPAVHHSEVYKRLYRPAYRLVAAENLDWDLTKPSFPSST